MGSKDSAGCFAEWLEIRAGHTFSGLHRNVGSILGGTM